MSRAFSNPRRRTARQVADVRMKEAIRAERAGGDQRPDKYLHAHARRRRTAERAAIAAAEKPKRKSRAKAKPAAEGAGQ